MVDLEFEFWVFALDTIDEVSYAAYQIRVLLLSLGLQPVFCVLYVLDHAPVNIKSDL